MVSRSGAAIRTRWRLEPRKRLLQQRSVRGDTRGHCRERPWMIMAIREAIRI